MTAALDLSPPVRAWFERRFGAPTPAQAAGWPAIARGEDVLIAAPTGSGKTLTAFLLVIDRLVRRADIERLDIAIVLAAQLGWDRSQRLAELAPPRLATPSGREVAIDYGSDNATASVRVQDLFGVDRHPCVADGRVPIVLELLSPADRPLQVTSDLPGFWAGSWAEVRKEMAGRYPKHHWPADPSKAVPKRLKDR